MSIIQKVDQQQGKFIELNQKSQKAHTLSEDEKSMINNEFSTSQVPLKFYGQSGMVTTEEPTSKGSTIDFKA